jgi:hypothetical protein
MEPLFEMLAELVLQIVFELLAEFGARTVSAMLERRPHPWLAGIGYVVFGAIAGAISLWPFPESFLKTTTTRVLNLLLTPVVAGLAMSALGRWRRGKDQALVRIDRFAWGYVFALAMAAVRFAAAR